MWLYAECPLPSLSEMTIIFNVSNYILILLKITFPRKCDEKHI